MSDSKIITLFLSGDVMTGRGIDQALPFPGDPVLFQSNRRNAADYLKFAEITNGPIQTPVDFSYIWGDALEVMKKVDPDLNIINLETVITVGNDYEQGKAIHFRMHPGNISCLKAADIDVCLLANNHILDWGYDGLAETLQTLKNAGIKYAGAGCSRKEAEMPAIINLDGKGRVLIFSYCTVSSGVPPSWEAERAKPGVNSIPDLSLETIRRMNQNIRAVKREGDVVVASIHWGNNWGYDIPDEQIRFAHELINEGAADIIHGHSSHHPRPLEVYKDKLIIYGAGDLINDFEGLKGIKNSKLSLRKLKKLWKLWKLNGHRKFRSDLVMMYFPTIQTSTGRLVNLKMIPMQLKKFRLNYPSGPDAEWLIKTLNKVNKKFNSRLELESESQGYKHNNILLRW